MAKKKAKAKKKVRKKVARKPAKKKRRSKQPGKRNHYAHIPKDILAEMERAPRHTNGFDITDKQSMFVEHLLCAAKWNATKAAKLAGYSAKSADHQGPALLRNPHVCKYLRKRIDDRRRRLEVKQDKVVDELAAWTFAKACEFASWRGNTLTVKSSEEIPEYLQGAIRSLEPVMTKYGRALKITFTDKVAAMKLLMQHLGMLDYHARDGSKGIIVEAMERLHAAAAKLDKEKTG